MADTVRERERVIMEIDSREWHLDPGRHLAAQRRQRRLVAAGWTVIAVAPRDVRTQPGQVCRQVLCAIGAGRPRANEVEE